MNNDILKKLYNYKEEFTETPLIYIPYKGSYIISKCEWANPTGSIKDRTAFGLIEDLLINNKIDENSEILEYSGGNLGKSIAEICYRLNLNLNLVFSPGQGENYKKSLVTFLENKNVKMINVYSKKGFWEVIETAKDIKKQNPHYHFLFQHENNANYKIHYNWTGQEFINQLQDISVDSWTAAIGSGGSLIGIYKALKEKHPRIQMNIVSPAEQPYGTEDPSNNLKKFAGTSGLGYGKKQKFVQEEERYINSHYTFYYEDALQEMLLFFNQFNIKIGSSSAANLLAAKSIIDKSEKPINVATIFPDAGSKEEWNNLID